MLRLYGKEDLPRLKYTQETEGAGNLPLVEYLIFSPVWNKVKTCFTKIVFNTFE